MSMIVPSPDELPPITVIVPAWRSGALLRLCLDHLTAQDYPGTYSVIVVDNDECFSLEHLKPLYPDVTFLWEGTPGSYNARNTALAAVTTPLVAFTDADCRPHPHWLREGVRALLADRAVGLVGGAIHVSVPEDRLATVAEDLETFFAFIQDVFVASGFAATANLLTKKAIFDEIGPFNGALRSGGDAEWCRRAQDRGFRLIYVPEAIVFHPARTHEETLAKQRRIVAGVRDKSPSWISCLRFCTLTGLPMLASRSLYLLFSRKFSRPAGRRIALVLYMAYLHLYTRYYRLYLQVTGAESPR